jgi:hypothetical protein
MSNRKSVSKLLVVFFLTLSILSVQARAQATKQRATSLNEASKAEIIDWVCTHLRETYVLPDKADEMVTVIRQKLKEGHYDKAADVKALTRLLTSDARSVYPDKHLSIYFDPKAVDALNKPIDEAERLRRLKARWRMNNFGFKSLDHLDGNIGYLKMNEFADARWGRDTAVGVMHFFANSDALIIDLRDNRGGYGSMITLMLSYFFDESTHIGSRYIRRQDFTRQEWTTDHVDGSKLTDTDLYVLTSRRTFSAAEAFAFRLQGMKRAVIVGENTAGGGHTVESVTNGTHKIVARIPDSRAFDPVTGKGFEGTGIVPDLRVSRDDAFEEAYILALRNLSKKAQGERKMELAWRADYRQVHYKPYEIDTGALEKMAGSYKTLKVVYENGRLSVIWPGESAQHSLLPISKRTFIVDGDPKIRLRFETDDSGKTSAVSLVYIDGYVDTVKRSK